MPVFTIIPVTKSDRLQPKMHVSKSTSELDINVLAEAVSSGLVECTIAHSFVVLSDNQNSAGYYDCTELNRLYDDHYVVIESAGRTQSKQVSIPKT